MRLIASDGHPFRAYECGPAEARAGLVVVQEIFGLNAHIRACCESWSQLGYRVLSPALFDRLESSGQWGLELDYTPEDIQRGMQLARQVGYFEHPLLEIQACIRELSPLPVGLIGYCWGGTLAWMAARQPQAGLRACVGYYGGMIGQFLDPGPQIPVMLHFGDRDPHIANEQVDAIVAAFPDLPIHRYAAGHGFNCEARGDFDAPSAALARQRSEQFLAGYLRPIW